MQRRTFLKSLVAAYCTPIVASLAPMLMRPVAVVEGEDIWGGAQEWIEPKTNRDYRVISNGCRLAWVDWVDENGTMHHNILTGDGFIELADCAMIVAAGGEGDGACGTVKVYDDENRYKAGAVISPNNGGIYFCNIPGRLPTPATGGD